MIQIPKGSYKYISDIRVYRGTVWLSVAYSQVTHYSFELYVNVGISHTSLVLKSDDPQLSYGQCCFTIQCISIVIDWGVQLLYT